MEVLEYWFSLRPEQWFNGSVDHEIRVRFSDLLKKAEAGELDHWQSNLDTTLALIIVLDQFTRNLNRGDDIRKNDAKCLPIAFSLMENDQMFSIEKRIFIYLPLRHTHQTHYLNIVLSKVKEMEAIPNLSKDEASLIRRFKNATLADFGKATDTIMTNEVSDYIDAMNLVGHKDVLAPESVTSVCKNFTDMTDQRSGMIYQSILNFIQTSFGKEPINICISLSGGVDSMVISLVLHVLREQRLINDVFAVHVDYANRQESDSEAAFVIGWCNYLNIKVYWRRIDHMCREDKTIDRSFYEEETKKIRFGLYKYAIKQHDVKGVILGHHGDDLDENVLMNIFRGKDLMYLNGMTPFQMLDGVPICRPLLNHSKKEIYDFSFKYQVPYLKDTTSENCYRGFMRKLMCQVHQFDQSISANIKLAGERSSEWQYIFEKMVLNKLLKSIVDYKHGFVMPYDPEMVDMPKVFWSALFVQMFHGRQIRMCSQKNLKQFIDWFNSSTKKNEFKTGIRLSNNHYCFKHLKNLCFINYDLINPIVKTTHTGVINGWKITFQPTEEQTNQPIQLADILNGDYTYNCPAKNYEVTYTKGKTKVFSTVFRGISIMKYLPKVKPLDEDTNWKQVRFTFQ